MLYLISLVSDSPPGTGLDTPERDVSPSQRQEKGNQGGLP